MKVAIMQPYFFPYVGYFQLIQAVDRFILDDNVQYIKQGWINRNRILKPQQGWQYIIVPLVRHSHKELIKDIRIVSSSDWKNRIVDQLAHYKKRAPYYKEVMELVKVCLATSEMRISKVNGHILKVICDYIGIPFNIEMESEVQFDYSSITHTGERPLRCKQISATEYVNSIGGAALYDKVELGKKGLKVSFLQPYLPAYDQGRETFEPGLSIIDVLMFNSVATVRKMMNDYQLI